jgi:hypothetical protein
MAFGNSDGDFEMLEWTTSGQGPRFGLLVHHTDPCGSGPTTATRTSAGSPGDWTKARSAAG